MNIRRTCFLLLISVGLTSSVAAVSLFPVPSYKAGTDPTSGVFADLDGDAWPDLNISILINSGDGDFLPKRDIPVGSAPEAVLVGDFNADGVNDIAVATIGPHQVEIALGTGDGNFGTFSGYPVGSNPASIAVGDFNEDEVTDIVAANTLSNSVSLLVGVGDGTFLPEQRYAVGNRPISISVGDVDGNDIDDIAVANVGSTIDGLPGSISILLGMGAGTFAPAITHAAADSPISIVLSDLDGDGLLDLAVAHFGSNDISTRTGKGDGTFNPEVRMTAGRAPRYVTSKDLDANGNTDLVVANEGSDDISVFLATGHGSFQQQSRYFAGNAPRSLAVGDVNGDDLPDVGVINVASDDVSIHTGSGGGALTSILVLQTPPTPMQVVPADVNADGFDDLITSSSVFLGTDNGSFSSAMGIEHLLGICATSDFNRDGFVDLASFDMILGQMCTHRGRGDGSFDSLGCRGIERFLGLPVVGDFNRDGNPDVSLPSSATREIFLLLGLGDGRFAPEVRLAQAFSPRALAVGDVDQDGVQDLVVGADSGIFFLRGLPGGFFSPAAQVDLRTGVGRIALGDFDGDGIPDIVANTLSTNHLYVLLGAGAGSFRPGNSFNADYVVNSLIAGDFGNHGLDDVAVANGDSSNSVSLFVSHGDGSFEASRFFVTAGGPHSLAVGDFDSDNRLDLAVVNADTDRVSVLLNGGAFPNHSPSAVAGPDQVIECTTPNGASILLDGSASTDSDSTPGTNDDIEAFEWFEDFGLPSSRLLGDARELQITLPIGVHRITLQVRDKSGVTDTDDLMVTIRDTTAPVISMSLAPNVLWPPNHRLVDVRASVSISDACSTPLVALALVTTSEPDDDRGGGDGNTAGDIRGAQIGVSDFDFQLRSERDGSGEGRVYQVIYTAVDVSGNQATASSIVLVPREQGGNFDPILLSVEGSMAGTVLSWDSVPGAFSYRVIRGIVADMREVGDFIDLGTVACVLSNVLAFSTLGYEDNEIPLLGDAFFYLAAYKDGLDSGYGSDTASKPRLNTRGGCDEQRSNPSPEQNIDPGSRSHIESRD